MALSWRGRDKKRGCVLSDLTGPRIHRFHGGIVLPGHKAPACDAPLRSLPPTETLVLPMLQHIGEPAKPIVSAGDRVRKGQMVAKASGYVSAPVHSPTSGRVTAIEDRPACHPSGLPAPSVVVEPDGEEAWAERPTHIDYLNVDPVRLRNIVREAGIVGMGGAGFPAYIKLNPGGCEIDTLIINGVECEPYICCDDVLMRHRARQILEGARIMQHMLDATCCVVAVEEDMGQALAATKKALGDDGAAKIMTVPTIYPAGGEKQLIHTLTGREVPSDGLPAQIGVITSNVATATAVYRAVVLGEPSISRVVTVTGGAVGQPQNLDVPVGTPIKRVLEAADTAIEAADRLVVGGPMMGFSLNSDEAPVTKTTNCLLLPRSEEVGYAQPESPCIRCGACTDVCPAKLLPQELYWHARARNLDRAQEFDLFDCIECGACAYVCPSNIPLIQYFRFAKTEIWTREREREKADIARRRYEFRKERLEREAAERKEKLRQRRAATAAGGTGEESKDPRKAAIAAATERARAKHRRSPEPGTEDQTAQERERDEQDDNNGRPRAAHE